MGGSLKPIPEIIPLKDGDLVGLDVILSGRISTMKKGVAPNAPSLDEMDHSRMENSLSFGRANNCCYAYIPLVEGIDPDLPSIFVGQIVVDLGAGEFPHAYQVIKICGAAAYIAVEPYYADRLARRLSDDWLNKGLQKELEQMSARPEYREVKPEIDRSVTCDDMLTFLKRLPSSSVSIFTNAIDECIIDPEYALLVDQEILRVLHPKGGLFCGSSRFRFYHSDGKKVSKTSSLEL